MPGREQEHKETSAASKRGLCHGSGQRLPHGAPRSPKENGKIYQGIIIQRLVTGTKDFPNISCDGQKNSLFLVLFYS
jgi:hypothetical protein